MICSTPTLFEILFLHRFFVSEIGLLSYNGKFSSGGQEEETESDVNQSKSSEQLISSIHFFSLLVFLWLFFPLLSNATISTTNFLSDTQSKEIIFSLWTHKYEIVYEIIESDFESVAAFWRIYGRNHWLIGWLLFYCLFTTFQSFSSATFAFSSIDAWRIISEKHEIKRIFVRLSQINNLKMV